MSAPASRRGAPPAALLLAAALLCGAPTGVRAAATYTYPDATRIVQLGVGTTFGEIYGLVLHSGSLYASQDRTSAEQLWRIDTTSGAATTFVTLLRQPTGSTNFYYNGIALNPAGDGLYVATQSGYKILEVPLATPAGTAYGAGDAIYAGWADFSASVYYPYGLAVSGADLYITDNNLNKVLKYTGGTATVLAGTNLPTFVGGLEGLAVGSGA
jgi:hypothetical protein